MFYIYLYSKLLCLILNSLQNSVSDLTFDLSQSTGRPTDPVSGQAGRQTQSTEVLAAVRIRVHVARSTGRVD